MQKFTINPEQILPEAGGGPSCIRITGQDARHMGKVLRLKPGDRVSMTDGRGTDYQGQVSRITGDAVEVEILSHSLSRTESFLDLTVCSAMLKDKKMDGVIRELVQIGVTAWVPFFASRSVPGPDPKKLARRLERWQAIARESLKQCRRSREIDIPFPCSFDGVLALAADAGHRIAFWEGAHRPLVMTPAETGGAGEETGRVTAVVLIGPEGGFTESEIERAKAAGFASYSLGPRILRAETAAVTAAVLIQYLLGDLGRGRSLS